MGIVARGSRRDLTGAVIVITGAARGIGLATAQQLAAQGARVCLADLDGDLAAREAAAIGPAARGYSLDVTDHDAYTALLDQVQAEVGPIDVLVNNAGVMPVGAFAEESPLITRRAFEINVFAAMHGVRQASTLMRERGGHIVVVASLGGKVPLPGAATYTATKHAIIGFLDAYRWELRGSRVQLSAVLPAMVNTDLAAGVRRTRATNVLEPGDVAAMIVDAVQRPRREVYAPAPMRLVAAATALTPRAISDFFTARAGADRLLLDSLASPQRAAYQQRLARAAGELGPSPD